MSEMVGRFPADELQQIVRAYEEGGSILKAFLTDDIHRSYADVQRALDLAEEMKLVVKNPTGRPKVSREEILELIEDNPNSSIAWIAGSMECSESTVFRAKRGE